MVEFFKSSPKALAAPDKNLSTTKFPWKEIPQGMSFPVNKSEVSLKSLRSMASTQGKRLNRRFRVVDHGESSPAYEVACLPSVGTGLSDPTSQPEPNNAPAFKSEAPISPSEPVIASWLQPQKEE